MTGTVQITQSCDVSADSGRSGWVAVKDVNVSYHHIDVSYTIYPNDANFE